MKRYVHVGLCLLTLLISSLGIAEASAEKALRVTVSIAPQKYFVERIGGDLVDVSVMVPPGATAERYEPKPRQMVALSESRIYFACGIPFEDAWLDKIAASNRNMRIVHTETGIAKRIMEAHFHEGDTSSKEASTVDHSHAGMKDPHIWLSPPLVMLQARSILDVLLRTDPAHRDSYEANYRQFMGELVDLDMAIRGMFPGKREGLRFMVFHPAWGYFADAYGLEQIPVEMEGKEPKAQDLERFIKLAREEGIKIIFVQPQFSSKPAETIAEAIGGRIMIADDLAEDWAKNLREVAQAIGSTLKGE